LPGAVLGEVWAGAGRVSRSVAITCDLAQPR
jgi:hypothetical protein